MRSGLIIYVVGKEPENWNADDPFVQENLMVDADSVEIITEKSGHFDVQDAWWALLARGMAYVSCKIARFEESGKIAFTGRELRLCG